MSGSKRQNLVGIPVTSPTVVQSQRAERIQAIAGRQTPLHATPLLPSRDQDVIGFFGMGTADKALVDSTLAVVGNEGLTGTEVAQQAIEGEGIVSLRARALQETQGAVDVALPQSAGETTQQLDTSQRVNAEATAEIPTFVAEMPAGCATR